MANNRIIELEQDATGRYIYIPQPDETEVRESSLFLDKLSLAVQLRPNDIKSAARRADISINTFLEILPEWVKDAFVSIAILSDLLTSRFMKDGKWVHFSYWRLAWNFASLIMIFRAAKDIVKTFKEPSTDE